MMKNGLAQTNPTPAQPLMPTQDFSDTVSGGQSIKGSHKASHKAVLLPLVGLTLSACLFGATSCTTPAPTSAPAPTESAPVSGTPSETPPAMPSMPSSEVQTNPSLGQQLPISAKAEMGGQEIFLEVAATREQQALGPLS